MGYWFSRGAGLQPANPAENRRQEVESGSYGRLQTCPTTNGVIEAPMSEIKRIGIAIVRCADQVLVGVRQEDQVLAGMAEFPGGKCESNEEPVACAVRECQEETGIEVRSTELLDQLQHSYSYGCVDLHFFLCELIQPNEPLPKPSGNFRWLPIGELAVLNFPEANQSIVERLTRAKGE
jgi:8-oxo-dGTP diphosphatase